VTGTPVTATADADVVRRLYEARQRSDLDAAAELIAEDVVWHEPYEYLGTLNGRDAVIDAIRQSMVETEGTFRLELTDLLASDLHVVALVDFSAERHGGWMSGREIGVFRVVDGKIVEVWFYTAEDPDAVSEFMRG
jgi:ketosteroid isomerase-like protein